MTPTMEEVAGWLREAAELAYLVSLRDGGARDKTILSQHYTKKREIFNDRAAQVEAMGWRPIEEAPKDGTLIDLWDGVNVLRLPDCKWLDGKWVYFDSKWEEWEDVTHFMHPPKPPAKN